MASRSEEASPAPTETAAEACLRINEGLSKPSEGALFLIRSFVEAGGESIDILRGCSLFHVVKYVTFGAVMQRDLLRGMEDFGISDAEIERWRTRSVTGLEIATSILERFAGQSK
jgi:hypothetical protein